MYHLKNAQYHTLGKNEEESSAAALDAPTQTVEKVLYQVIITPWFVYKQKNPIS